MVCGEGSCGQRGAYAGEGRSGYGQLQNEVSPGTAVAFAGHGPPADIAPHCRSRQQPPTFSRCRIHSPSDLERSFRSLLGSDDVVLAFLLDASHDGVSHWSLTDDVAWNHRGLCALLGCDVTAMPATSSAWRMRLHDDDRSMADHLLEQHLANPAIPCTYVGRYRRKDERIVHLHTRSMAIRDTGGAVRSVLTIFTDVTALYASAEERPAYDHFADRSRIFVEQSPFAIAMFDTDVCYLAASRQWKQDYRLMDQDIIGRSHYEIFPEIGDDWKRIHQECLRGSINRSDGTSFVRADGTEQWIIWDVRPWYHDSGVVGGLLMYTADVTDRHRVEEQLRISEERFRNAFDHGAIGMGIVDRDGHWTRVNESLCRIVGYATFELVGRNFRDITHPEDVGKDNELLKDLIAGKRHSYQLEKRYFHKRGHVVWVILAVSVVRDTDGQPLHFITQLTDISQRKYAEQQTSLALAKLDSVMQAASEVAIIATDAKGVISSFNKGAENLLGYGAEDVVGRCTPAIFHIDSEVQARSVELTMEFGRPIVGLDIFVERARHGTHDSHEWTFVRKDGSQFPAHLVITASYDGRGTIDGYVGVAMDITQIKQAEADIRALLDVASDQNQRLLNFAHIVSHNLKSHSANMTMLSKFLLTETDPAEQQEMIAMLAIATKNLQETVHHLGDVVTIHSRTDENMTSVPLREAVDGAVGAIQALVRSADGAIDVVIDATIRVLAIPAYLDSVLINVLSNAIKYRSPARAPHVVVTAERDTKRIIVRIRDNGLGIDLRRHGAKLFGMYKTFHGNADARGIGLFITKNQVEAMHGRIDLESEPDQGTTVVLTLREDRVAAEIPDDASR